MKQVLGLLAQGWRIVAWGITLALASALSSTLAMADGVPLARDLQRDGVDAKTQENAVLVVFVGEHCSYCNRVLNEFLIPMSGNQEYKNKVVMRRIEQSGDDALRDFSGMATTHAEFASRNKIRFVPTVAVFDQAGQLLAKPLVGLTTVDYYGGYLDEMIDAGLAKLRPANYSAKQP